MKKQLQKTALACVLAFIWSEVQEVDYGLQTFVLFAVMYVLIFLVEKYREDYLDKNEIRLTDSSLHSAKNLPLPEHWDDFFESDGDYDVFVKYIDSLGHLEEFKIFLLQNIEKELEKPEDEFNEVYALIYHFIEIYEEDKNAGNL